jgi:curved DNA-binding protein CbpA
LKSVEMQNYYEVLEVSRGAGPEEIERAYRIASATWSKGSLALYSLFDEHDAAIIRERIGDAYRTLSDEAARRAYDLDAFDEPYDPEDLEGADPHVGAARESSADVFDAMDAALDAKLEDGVEQVDSFDGPVLRRIRMQRGIEIADIADTTKVSRAYLRCIEDEDWSALPAPVYVRGFVSAYAKAVGLDPKQVAASYMPRFEEARQGKSRGRLLGRF